MDSSQVSSAGQDHDGHDLQSAIRRLGVQQAPQQPLHVEALDPSGQLIAGVYGYLSVGWLVVQMLWVHEGHRKQGLARNILHQLEVKAAEQKVLRARTDIIGNLTAVAFYERRGYSIYTTLPATLPDGSEETNYFLRKDLVQTESSEIGHSQA